LFFSGSSWYAFGAGGSALSVEIDMHLETLMFLAVRVSDFMVRVMLPGYPGEEDFRVDLSVLWE
jgi:hypothetical protein